MSETEPISAPLSGQHPAAKQSQAAAKELLKAPVSTWMWATGFLLTLSLVGLSFYPALIFTIFILINRFATDRYDFLIMVAILVTGTGYISPEIVPFDFTDPLLALSCLGLIIYRKNVMIKKVTVAVFLYILFLLIMSTFSDESFAIQVLTIRRYAAIIMFILPLWVFANRRFDIRLLMSKILVFFLIICGFYCLDGFILNGWALLPNTYSFTEVTSTFWDLRIQPFSSYFPRKYPSGMFIIVIAAYPLARYYRLRWWQWAIVILAFASTRTITVVAAFVLTYVTFQGRFLKFAKYLSLAAIGFAALYFIDGATGGFMRVQQAVDQFSTLNDSSDTDDLAEFGTSRMAQIIPKYEALVDQGCLVQGFGFLHPTKTVLPRYQITNDYYSDITRSEENVAMVEVSQFNTVLHTGILGLCVEIAFYLYLFFILKPGTTDSRFYLSSLLMTSIMGLGGYGGLNQHFTLAFVALALGAALLDARPQWRSTPSGSAAESSSN